MLTDDARRKTNDGRGTMNEDRRQPISIGQDLRIGALTLNTFRSVFYQNVFLYQPVTKAD